MKSTSSKIFYIMVVVVDLFCSRVVYAQEVYKASDATGLQSEITGLQSPATTTQETIDLQAAQQGATSATTDSFISQQNAQVLSISPSQFMMYQSNLCMDQTKIVRIINDTSTTKVKIESAIAKAASTDHVVCLSVEDQKGDPATYDATNSNLGGEITVTSFDPVPTQPIIISGLGIKTKSGFGINVAHPVILHKFRVEVDGGGKGIVLNGKDHQVVDSAVTCLASSVAGSVGIEVNSEESRIEKVTIAGCETGIEINASGVVVTSSNITKASLYGIYVMKGMGNFVDNTIIDETGEAFKLEQGANNNLGPVTMTPRTDDLHVQLPVGKPIGIADDQVIGKLTVCLVDKVDYTYNTKILCRKVLATQDIPASVFKTAMSFSVNEMEDSRATIYYSDLMGNGTGQWGSSFVKKPVIVVGGAEGVTIPSYAGGGSTGTTATVKVDDEEEKGSESGMYAGDSPLSVEAAGDGSGEAGTNTLVGLIGSGADAGGASGAKAGCSLTPTSTPAVEVGTGRDLSLIVMILMLSAAVIVIIADRSRPVPTKKQNHCR